MKQIICFLFLLLLFTPAVTYSAESAQNTYSYTDKDLKQFNYNNPTQETSKSPTTSSGIIEYRDLQARKQQEDEYRQSLGRQFEQVKKEILISEEAKKQAEKKVIAGVGILGTMLLLPIAVLAVQFIIWIIALIDILKNEFTGSNKIIWLLVVTFLPFIGPLLYYFMADQHKIDPELV